MCYVCLLITTIKGDFKKRKQFLLVWFDNNILLFQEVKKTIVDFTDYSCFKALDMKI